MEEFLKHTESMIRENFLDDWDLIITHLHHPGTLEGITWIKARYPDRMTPIIAGILAGEIYRWKSGAYRGKPQRDRRRDARAAVDAFYKGLSQAWEDLPPDFCESLISEMEKLHKIATTPGTSGPKEGSVKGLVAALAELLQTMFGDPCVPAIAAIVGWQPVSVELELNPPSKRCI